MIRVFVADESSVVVSNITRRLALEDDIEVCGSAADGEVAVQDALRLQPDIAIVDAGLPGMDGGQTTEMLRQYVPGAGVIMMSMEAENDAFRLAMLAGAREFLQKPFKGDDLVAAVRRVHAFEQRTGAALQPRAIAPTRVATPAAGSPSAAARKLGRVTCVASGRGGVGKTVLAANLAVALGVAHPDRVVLVDLSLQFGDVAATLNLTAEHSITDLVAPGPDVDADFLRQVLQTGPGGIRVLLAPTTPDQAEYITAPLLRNVLSTLRTMADHVVVDTPTFLTDVTLSALDAADRVVLVTDLTVPGVKNARLLRGVFDVLKIEPERVLAVGNHREAHGELDRSGAESFLGARLALEIPFEPEVVATSVAEGAPFVLGAPSSQSAAAMRALAQVVDPTSQTSSEASRRAESAGKKRKSRRMLGFSRA
jgi:pilus assembly protein CpaE